MISKKIKIGDSEIIYASIDFLDIIKSDKNYLYNRSDLSLLKEELNKVSRVSIVKYSNVFFVFFLKWIVSMDLEKLDQKVINDSVEDSDFIYAFYTYQQPKLVCKSCNHIYEKGGLLYLTDFSVGGMKYKEEKLKILREMKPGLTCPKCGGHFGTYVFHLF